MKESDMEQQQRMEVLEIQKILPHRYPFLLVDRILESDRKSRIVGLKNLTINEPFFQGHFPDNPIMPGVLQLEAMAQVSGVLMNQVSAHEGQIAYFLSIDKARFRRVLRPGDQMRIECELKKIRLGMARFYGRVMVDGELASEADLMFAWAKEG
jgi:3-hydroxyacyl-[acyl-carrier-protein] dehydratase